MIVFRRQILTSLDVRFWRLKTITAMKELKKMYNGRKPIIWYSNEAERAD